MANKRMMKKAAQKAAAALGGNPAPIAPAAPVRLAPSPKAIGSQVPKPERVRKAQPRKMNSEQRYQSDPKYRDRLNSSIDSELLRTNPGIADRLTGNGPMYDTKRTVNGPTYSPPGRRAESRLREATGANRKAVPPTPSVRVPVAQHPASRVAVSPEKARRTAESVRKAKRTADKTAAIRGVDTSGGFIGATLGTAGKMYRTGRSHFSEQGNLGKAFAGTVQASAVSGAGHAGLAAIQGEDPWEAAKTGIVRGAFVGGGYQGMKAMTGANAKTIRGNLKQIGQTTRGVYSAHTPGGNAAMMANPDKVSHLVRKVMQNTSDSAKYSSIFGLK